MRLKLIDISSSPEEIIRYNSTRTEPIDLNTEFYLRLGSKIQDIDEYTIMNVGNNTFTFQHYNTNSKYLRIFKPVTSIKPLVVIQHWRINRVHNICDVKSEVYLIEED